MLRGEHADVTDFFLMTLVDTSVVKHNMLKKRATIKIIPHLAFILVPKNGPTTKIKKKCIVVTKGLKWPAYLLNYSVSFMQLHENCSELLTFYSALPPYFFTSANVRGSSL